ncbi:MAG: MarR family transcriptional regulator [Verrucomicrobiota bacterium]
MAARKKKLTDADYTRLADFRHALRCFLEFSEIAAGKEGLTPQQHQALLVIRASPAGEANIGRLAERLRIRHNTAVELANRLEAAGLVAREVSATDRRSVVLRLTEDGASRLEVLTHVHRNELRQLRPEIVGLLGSIGPEGD